MLSVSLSLFCFVQPDLGEMEARIDVEVALQSVEVVYREHHEWLRRSLLAFTGDASITDDAIAEALGQALRRCDAIQDLERWVWRPAYPIAAGH